MKREYEEAFAEVDEMLKIMPADLLRKIPTQFKEMISLKKAKDYNIKIQEPLEQQHLKQETIAILGLIYRDFLSSPEERERLQFEDNKKMVQIEQEMQQEYDITSVLKSRRNNKIEEEYSTDLTIYKEPGFIKKFFNLIKGLFKKNKF